MNQHELLRIIEQAAREGWTALDLSNQGLTELPPEIGDLVNLTKLDLRYNRITALSYELGNLINLVDLDLSGNLFANFPVEIVKLAKLEGLYLSNNYLTTSSLAIKNLISLKTLDLQGNRLDRFPIEITNLTSLIELYIGNNQIAVIPREIEKLKNLVVLNLRYNQLTELPSEIGQLTELRRLSLRANKLSKIPNEIKNLTKLERLSFIENPLPVPVELLELVYEPDKLIDYCLDYQNRLKDISSFENQKIRYSLKFSDQNLFTFPIEIFEQPHLQELDLMNNKLMTLPGEIKKLIWLEVLMLGHNQISSLPREIGDLIHLRLLYVGGNQLSDLPHEITNLVNLKELDLEYNRFSTFPSEITRLIGLRRISFIHNYLKNLPNEIGNLKNLERLYLRENQLTSVPDEIGNLKELNILDLRNNQLTALPYAIGNFYNLIDLDLENNFLTTLPQTIKKLTRLKSLRLRGNSLPIPPELLESTDDPQKILNYYFQQGTKKPLHEVKVLIVGQGAVGKTSLIKRLLDDSFNPHETKTDGIAINQWHLPMNGADIRLNLWDFGGQEIMHATHQFFLTKRSLYVLVLDSRLDEQNNRVEYWLKIIQSFGGDSPIIVVCNKCDEHSLDLNWKGLQEKYPTIKNFARRLSCKTGEGLTELRSLIAQEVGQLPHLHDELLLTWFAVKTRLEEMEENYIGYNDYQQMCVAEQVTDELSQQTLLGFLHDLGIVLHFHDHPILEDTNVLNPEWVTRGIYQIVNSNELFQRKGELERSVLTHILPATDYPRSKHQFILDMMRKFELCFDFAESAGERFLVPDLLSREEPYTGEWGDSLAFQYHYDILPGSVISRFMVRMHAYIHQKTYWRNGVVLISDHGQNRALVKSDSEDRKIFIHVSGRPETRSLFLAIIRADFRKIHATIPRLNLKEVIPLPGYPNVTIDYADLLKLREKRISSYYYPKADAEINVNELLDGLDPAKSTGTAVTLTFGVQQQITSFLTRLPGLQESAGQRALVYSAGLDAAIQDQLQFGLPVAQFVNVLVTLLMRHGKLADGRLALVAVLEAAQNSVGRDAQAQCGELINTLRSVL